MIKWKKLLYKKPFEPRIRLEDIPKVLKDPKKYQLLEEDYDIRARKAARIYFETAKKNYRIC